MSARLWAPPRAFPVVERRPANLTRRYVRRRHGLALAADRSPTVAPDDAPRGTQPAANRPRPALVPVPLRAGPFCAQLGLAREPCAETRLASGLPARGHSRPPREPPAPPQPGRLLEHKPGGSP